MHINQKHHLLCLHCMVYVVYPPGLWWHQIPTWLPMAQHILLPMAYYFYWKSMHSINTFITLSTKNHFLFTFTPKAQTSGHTKSLSYHFYMPILREDNASIFQPTQNMVDSCKLYQWTFNLLNMIMPSQVRLQTTVQMQQPTTIKRRKSKQQATQRTSNIITKQYQWKQVLISIFDTKTSE